MVFKCSVPFCKGNYRNGPNVSVFSLPKDENLRKKWLYTIPRKNINPKNFKVCEMHFKESDIKKEASAYDSKTGMTVTARLQIPRLKKGAVPSQFMYPHMIEQDKEHPEGISEDDSLPSQLDDDSTERAPSVSGSSLSRDHSDQPQDSTFLERSSGDNTSSDVNMHLTGVGVDSSSPNVVKIKTEVDDGEYSAAATSKEVTTFAITNTDADDFTNVRIADVRTVVTSAATHTPIVPITSLLTWPGAITAGSTALGSITKTVPLIISGTQLKRSNEVIQADGHRMVGQNLPKTSKDSPAVAIQHLPIVIKTEPVDDREESVKLVETHAEERSQENTGDSPEPPPSKKRKMDGDSTENHGALPLNVQNSILERLDALNRNLETNTCAMSILSKAIKDSSESNVRAINHLANAISNVGSLIYSSLQQMNLQKGQ